MSASKSLSADDRVAYYERLYRDTDYGTRPIPAHGAILGRVRALLGKGCSGVLDVGCGRGLFLRELARETVVQGTEIVPHLLANDLSDLVVFPYSASDMKEFKPGSFDIVIACNVLDHLAEEEMYRALDEICRIAARHIIVAVNSSPDGQLIEWQCARWNRILTRIPRGMVSKLSRKLKQGDILEVIRR